MLFVVVLIQFNCVSSQNGYKLALQQPARLASCFLAQVNKVGRFKKVSPQAALSCESRKLTRGHSAQANGLELLCQAVGGVAHKTANLVSSLGLEIHQ